MNANNNEKSLTFDDGSRQQHDSSFSSDDTEFLGLPSSPAAATTTTPFPSQRSVSVCDTATQPDQLALLSHMISFVDSNNESDSIENENERHHVSSSTTPTPPIACNYHCDRHYSPEWSSSDENTTFYGDKNSILSSACDADRRLATSEYFQSSCGGYITSFGLPPSSDSFHLPSLQTIKMLFHKRIHFLQSTECYNRQPLHFICSFFTKFR